MDSLEGITEIVTQIKGNRFVYSDRLTQMTIQTLAVYTQMEDLTHV